MRTPGQIQAQTRRGLSVVFHRPLASNTKNAPQQQAQGLKIAAIPAPSPSLAPNVVRATKDVAPMAVASRTNAFFRAFAQLRESISSIFPTAITLGTAVTFFETTNDVVMCEAEVEPEMTDPAAVVSAVLSEAAHSEQPLIFSAHNIESYLAARQSAKESTEARSSMPGAFASIRGQQRAKSPTSILQSVMRQYLLKPVAHFNSRVIETTQSTLGSFVSFNTSARKAHGGKKLEKTNYWRVGLTLATIVIVYDAAVLAVGYALLF